jgi:hypothetical protein
MLRIRNPVLYPLSYDGHAWPTVTGNSGVIRRYDPFEPEDFGVLSGCHKGKSVTASRFFSLSISSTKLRMSKRHGRGLLRLQPIGAIEKRPALAHR